MKNLVTGKAFEYLKICIKKFTALTEDEEKRLLEYRPCKIEFEPNNKKRKVINLKTLEIYPSIRKAAIAFNISYQWMTQQLKKHPNKYGCIYLENAQEVLKEEING